MRKRNEEPTKATELSPREETIMASAHFKILVGIDFGPSSVRALAQAVRIAQRHDGELDLVHVFPYTAKTVFAELVKARGELAQAAQARASLEALRTEEIPAGMRARVHLRIGDPSSGLI